MVVAISEPVAIEPSNSNPFDSSGSQVTRTICDPLIQFDPASGALRPALAHSWQVTDGGTVITVRLRKGVHFQNGQELTSEDVVYSLSRVASKDFGSSMARLLEPVVGFEKVHGDEETSDERARTTLTGVKSLGSTTFQITLKRPQADFLRVLGLPLASPVPKRLVEKDPQAYARKPVCTGPYVLTEPWSPGATLIRVTRFSGYYAGNAAFSRGGRGYVDSIEFRVFPGRGDSLAAFQAGGVDVARVPRPDAATAQLMGDALVRTPTSAVELIGLPTQIKPFDRPEVRLALSEAIDRRAIVDLVYGGARTPATGIVPPTVGTAYGRGGCGSEAPESGAVKAARARLAAAGVDLHGVIVPFYFNDEFDNRALVGAVASQWRDAFGLDARLSPMGWEKFDARGRSPGFDGPFRITWQARFPSPDDYLFPLFDSRSIGEDNFGRFDDNGVDRTLERSARRADDAADRSLEYRRAEKLICEKMPAIPVVFGEADYLFRKSRIDSAVERFTELTTTDPLLRELYER